MVGAKNAACASVLLVVLALFAGPAPAEANGGALDILITPKALNYFLREVAPRYLASPQFLNTDYFAGWKPEARNGKATGVKWELQTAFITALNFNEEESEIKLNHETQEIQILMKEISVDMDVDVKLKLPLGRMAPRDVSVALKHVAAEIVFKTSVDTATGLPVFEATKLHMAIPLEVGKTDCIEIKISKPSDKHKDKEAKFITWLVDRFDKTVRKQILAYNNDKDTFELINKYMKEYIAMIPLEHEVPAMPDYGIKAAKIQLKTLDDGLVKESDVRMLLGASVFIDGSDKDVCQQCTPLAFPAEARTEKMAEVAVGEFLPCCAINALREMKLFQFGGTLSLPDLTKYDNDYAKNAAPMVDAIMKQVKLQYVLKVEGDPTLEFTATSVKVAATLSFKLWMESIETKETQDFIDVTVSLSASLAVAAEEADVPATEANKNIAGKKIVLSPKIIDAHLAFKSTKIFEEDVAGHINSAVSNYLGWFIPEQVLPVVNKHFVKGFDVPPAPGTTFQDLVLGHHTKYVKVDTDFELDVQTLLDQFLPLEEVKAPEIPKEVETKRKSLWQKIKTFFGKIRRKWRDRRAARKAKKNNN